MQVKRPLAMAAWAAVAAFCALLLFGPMSASAEDLGSKLEKTEERLGQVEERQGVLTSTITEYGDEIERLTDEVAALRTEEAATRERLTSTQAELDGAMGRLDGAQEQLTAIRAQLKRALLVLRERLIAIYESGSPDVLSVIVDSAGVDDLAARTEYLDRIRGMDEAAVGRVRDLRNEAKGLVVELQESKLTIEKARDEIAAEEQSLASSRSQLQARQGELVAARQTRESALARISTHAEELEGDVSAVQSEIAAQLAETGAAPLPAGPIQEGSGGLIWPVSGPVVSGFGGREIGAGYEDHPGIDIAVGEGTPIRAAASGTVALQQSDAESGGYGNFTCLDHGGGLSTCYAHQSSFAVSAGDSVSQGEIIGYTGCTGYCLGPHLHFEVRIYGQVTDPMGYL